MTTVLSLSVRFSIELKLEVLSETISEFSELKNHDNDI